MRWSRFHVRILVAARASGKTGGLDGRLLIDPSRAIHVARQREQDAPYERESRVGCDGVCSEPAVHAAQRVEPATDPNVDSAGVGGDSPGQLRIAGFGAVS